MSHVEICNIEQMYEGKRVGHKFDIAVRNALADGDAKVHWFERTDRRYEALDKNEVWEDLFLKFCTSEETSNLFREAYETLPEEGEPARQISFTIHDEPSIIIGKTEDPIPGSTDIDSRRLDFIIIVQLTGDDIYIAACQQVIEVDGQQKKLIKAEFKTTGFRKETAEEADRIRMELHEFQNAPFADILGVDGLSRLQTVNSFTG